MPTVYDYQRVSEALTYSRDHFEEAESLFSTEDTNQAAQFEALKSRWQKTLVESSAMARWVKEHHRLHTEPVFAALEALAKYADVRRPFRLSVIGQKGVGKSALVNALLGATDIQYTPSEVAGKAVSGTRIRLVARPTSVDGSPDGSTENGESLPTWRVVFLTPRRLWEVAQFLLNVARLEAPKAPNDLDNREAVLQTLTKLFDRNKAGPDQTVANGLVMGAATQIQAANARKTLQRIVEVYRQQTEAEIVPANYRLDLDDPDIDGPVSSYIRQGADDLYLIVDYVERQLEPAQAGLLAGRAIELEDVLGLDDPRDSFFALEAFRESFAVIMVFKCDRGLNTESSSILQSLFSRDETELARFGNAADLNKAIIVANQFDGILANVSADRIGTGGSGNPLKGIEDIRRELSKYTRQPVPIYLTSASVARAAQQQVQLEKQRIAGAGAGTGVGTRAAAGTSKPAARSMPAYNFYLDGLSNLLQALEGQPTPDYLEFIREKQGVIESVLAGSGVSYPQNTSREEIRGTQSKKIAGAGEYKSEDIAAGEILAEVTDPAMSGGEREQAPAKAALILELSGLPQLAAKVREALENGSILRGRVANAEYYYGRVVVETALAYARHMASFKLRLGEFAHPAASQESRLFLKFQHAMRQEVEQLDEELRREWFEISRRYIFGPQTAEVEKIRQGYLETIKQVVMESRQLIQLEQHIPTGQLVTDAWRKVFEDVNDWLALEAGRQMRALVGPVLQDIERLAAALQKQLSELAAFPLDDTFWSNYRQRLAVLNRKLQDQAETLALSFYTDNRFSVYDVKVSESLQMGDAYRRKSEVVRLLQERTLGWFTRMYQLIARISMTNLNSFVDELRYYVLGLPATNSLLVGLELVRPGSAQLAPEDSLLSLLNLRYQTDEAFRRQYALREPTPAERLILEIRGWLALIGEPLDALGELSKAVTISAATLSFEDEDTGSQQGRATDSEALSNDYYNEANTTATSNGAAPARSRSGPGERGTWPSVEDRQAQISNNTGQGETFGRVNRLTIPVECPHPFPAVTRQYWEVANPDEEAEATRLHFNRIDLGNNNPSQARIVLESFGRKQTLVISGQQQDFWSDPLPGRSVTVRFLADNATPAWGFVLDALESVTLATNSTTVTSR